MIDVLGFELNRAGDALTAAGYQILCREVRSRKGVAGNQTRVIRSRLLSDGKIELSYSVFKTDVAYPGEGCAVCAASLSEGEDG